MIEIKDNVIVKPETGLVFNNSTGEVIGISGLAYIQKDGKEYLMARGSVREPTDAYLLQNYIVLDGSSVIAPFDATDSSTSKRDSRYLINLDSLYITDKTHPLNTYLILYLKQEFKQIFTKDPKSAKAILKELSKDNGAKVLSNKKIESLLEHVGSNYEMFFRWIIYTLKK